MAKPPRAKLPWWIDEPVALALRSGLMALTIPEPRWAIGMGRRIGRWWARSRVNRRHYGRCVAHLRFAFPSWPEDRIVATAVGAHEHLVMLAMETAFVPRLLNEQAWTGRLHVGDAGKAIRALVNSGPVIMLTGHCGNWELCGYGAALIGFPMHALYRPLDFPALDRWLHATRSRRGLTLVDKFGALRELPELLAEGAPLGFVADQSGGDRGVFAPFFGRLTSTYKSIGLLAMQFNATVVCAGARRLPMSEADETGMAFRLEAVDQFGPAEWSTHPDPLFYLTARYRHALETMIRRAPDQYLWMHRIWRSRPLHERSGKPFPAGLREKLRLLPWMTEEELDRIVETSGRDARRLAETGKDRLE